MVLPYAPEYDEDGRMVSRKRAIEPYIVPVKATTLPPNAIGFHPPLIG